jgi:hypothetical protein
MQIEINGNKGDLSAMLVSAVRYALGRRTYIVNWVCEFIENNKHLLRDSDRKVIIRDIKEQEKYGYGDKCDEEDWMKLLKILEED